MIPKACSWFIVTPVTVDSRPKKKTSWRTFAERVRGERYIGGRESRERHDSFIM